MPFGDGRVKKPGEPSLPSSHDSLSIAIVHRHQLLTFSIITVTYNAAATVERTLRSVLSQTYRGVEYIVIDGASTDGTPALVRRYMQPVESLPHRVNTLVSEPDHGLYDAMNKGLSLATGHYIWFLNAGDCLHSSDTLQHVADSIGQPDESYPTTLSPGGSAQEAGTLAPISLTDVVYGFTAIVDHEGRFLRMRRLVPPDRLTWRSFRQGMLVCHQAFIARRELCPRYDLRYHYSADYDWCIRVMRQATRLHNTHLTLVDYLSQGLTTRHHRASLVERLRIMARHYGWPVAIAEHLWFVIRAIIRRYGHKEQRC